MLDYINKARTKLSLSALVLLFVTVLIWQTCTVSIQSGQQGVYWSRFFGGTSEAILREGTNFKLPWDKIIIYDMRHTTINNTSTILSKGGIGIKVQWSVSFFPDPARLPELHRTIGPDYVQSVILPESISSLRQIFAHYRAEEILAYDKNSFTKQLNVIVLGSFSTYPIMIENLYIEAVEI